jgi:hypothetical protein
MKNGECEIEAVVAKVATTRKVEKKREGVRLVLTVSLRAEELDADMVEELGNLQRGGEPVIFTLGVNGGKPVEFRGIVERQATQREMDSEEAGPRLVTTLRVVSDAVEVKVLAPLAKLQHVSGPVGVRMVREQMELPGT